MRASPSRSWAGSLRERHRGIQVRSHTIAVPSEFLGQGEHFGLEVRGDSMIDAGIHDGTRC